jgi:Mrp family chromosome partitioning ATPase
MWFSRKKRRIRTSAYVRPPWTELPMGADGKDDGREFSVDFSRLAWRGFITPETLELAVARDFSMVKRRLFWRLNFFDRAVDEFGEERRPIIMMTSGNPGEGKTFSSINCALSLAIEEQLKVLLIDADLAKPSVPEILGYPRAKKGLFDCLTDDGVEPSEVLLKAGQMPLWIMPAGRATKAPASLLGSDRMAAVLRKLTTSGKHDVLVVDGPPLLATTEAGVLCPYADEVVLVVGAGDATTSQINASLDLLDTTDGNISLLLNRAVISEKAAAEYGYGYAEDELETA